jgi:transcriptional regulator with GAF, ATPase, and Fis domain
MESHPQQGRPPRLHVRVRCELEFGSERVVGHSSNISLSGMYVRFPEATLATHPLAPGDVLSLRFLLPDQTAWTRVKGELVWLEPGELDLGGVPVVGLGLRMTGLGAQALARVEAFVRDYRCTVMCIDAQRSPALVQALGESYRLVQCTSLAEARARLPTESVAALVVGHLALEPRLEDLLVDLAYLRPYTHIVKQVSAGAPEDEQVRAFVRLGRIVHRLREPVDPAELKSLIDRAVDAFSMGVENESLKRELQRANQRLQRENAYLRRRAQVSHSFAGIVGSSVALRQALSQLERVRETSVTVFIGGETGTGKELVARALHSGGARSGKPFVVQNCAGMTETLLQSTLFGHRRGAFTGADRDQPGVFQEADGGTLFLDEVGELSPSTQGILLRVLENGEVTPVGAPRPVRVDVRLVSASNKDLWREVEAGRFREDLYFRLMVVSLEMPPLRAREGDVPLLARHFLELHCQRYAKNVPGFLPEAMEALEACTWPGNVRELENEVERLVVLSPPDTRIPVELLSPRILRLARGEAARAAGPGLDFDDLAERFFASGRGVDEVIGALESTILGKALTHANGNQTRAAQQLRIARQTLHSRLRRYGMAVPSQEEDEPATSASAPRRARSARES